MFKIGDRVYFDRRDGNADTTGTILNVDPGYGEYLVNWDARPSTWVKDYNIALIPPTMEELEDMVEAAILAGTDARPEQALSATWVNNYDPGF